MERNKAFICGVMLGRSNCGFGYPSHVDIRACINDSKAKPRYMQFMAIDVVDRLAGDRRGDGAVELIADESEHFINRFLMDSYTDEQFAKDYREAAHLWELASIPNHEIAERFERIFQGAQTMNLVVVPLSKAEMDLWIKNMPAESPTGVAVMVGYNYAMNQVRNLLEGRTND